MSDLPSIGGSLRAAAARQREFVSLYRLVLIVEALFGLLLLIAPRFMARAFALPGGAEYRLWGAMLLFAVLLQLPGLLSPIHARVTVIAALVGRVLLALVYLLLSLWLPALVAVVAIVALSILFTRLLEAEIMSRP